MLKTLLCLIIIVLISFNLHSVSNFAAIFTLFNPSAENLAFGLDAGTADIWHRNPLSVWSNPAKLGYYKGLSFGYSRDAWLDKVDVLNDLYHNSSYLSFGWKGIGISLPFVNNNQKFGTILDLGEQVQTDENGNYLGTYNPYETCSEFAVGVNTLEFLANLSENSFKDNIYNLSYYTDLSLGYSFNYIFSDLVLEGTVQPEQDVKLKAKSHFHNIGLIARVSPFNSQNYEILNIDFTGGIKYLNISEEKINYPNSGSDANPLPYGTKTAISGRLALNLEDMLSKSTLLNNPANNFISSFCKDLLSIYASYEENKYGDRSTEYDKGVEFGLLNIFYLRSGEHSDNYGLSGKISGYGINLSYKNWFHLQYNHVSFPGGGLQETQEKSDYMINVNILKIIENI